MSNSIENSLRASNQAPVTFLPSIFPGCQDTPPQGEGVYKFNLVVHSRVEQRGQSVVTLGSDKLTSLSVMGNGAQAAIRCIRVT